jgi:hypothetical protein
MPIASHLSQFRTVFITTLRIPNSFRSNIEGQRIQPFWIEEAAKKLPNTNSNVESAFKPHAIRDDWLIHGQQQSFGAATAKLVIEALGV